MKEKPSISVVFPAYNEEGNVVELHRRILAALTSIGEPFEIIAVAERASTDQTIAKLKTLSPLKLMVIGYKTGQSPALDAGITEARGDVVVTIDADLQNDPQDIPRMYNKLKEGYDAVVGWRQNRHDTLGRRIFSGCANVVTRNMLGVYVHDYACALKMFKKKFIQGVRLYGEMHVFLVGILHLRGARVVEMPVAHHERVHGLSKHNFIKGIKDFVDLLTVKFMLGTSRPLLVFFGVSVFFWTLACAGTIWAIVLKLMHLRNFAQTPLPIIVSLFIIIGVMSLMMGFLSELVLRVFYETRKETPYVISEVSEQ